jgi:uncharacterized protein YndB with AHSA1/START domain
MKSVADPKTGVVRAEIEIRASPSEVFDALTDPAQLEAWWGSDNYYRTKDWISELWIGGKRGGIAIGADGKVATVRGEYRAIERPSLIEFTWEASWDDFASTLVRAEIYPIPTGTLLKVIHSGFLPGSKSSHGYVQGWGAVLNWLTKYFLRSAPRVQQNQNEDNVL